MSEDSKSSLGLCARITVALVTAKPGLTIIRFWQGIADIILRAIVAALSLVALISGSVYSSNSAVADAGDSRNAVGGWIGFVAFIVMVVELVVIAARFINFAFVYQYPLVMMIADVVFSGVSAVGIGIGFIVTAVNAADFQSDRNGPPRDAAAATSAFCLFVLIGLVVEIVWAVLWFLFKWYLVLKNRYEGGHETTQGEEEEEPADL